MHAIKVLRQRAADRRDKAIKAARDEFKKAIRLLDELEGLVDPEPEPVRRKAGPRPIIDLIQESMPRDKPFTLPELVECLKHAEPGREFHVPSVRTLLPDLVKIGAMRKVRRAAGGHVYWAHPDCQTADSPIAAMSIADATEHVLAAAGRPLNNAEIVVALKEAGYKPEADPRSLMLTLRSSFKRNKGRFKRGEGGRWMASGR